MASVEPGECSEAESKKTWCMGPYAGVDYNLTLCPLQSRLQNIYPGQPYAIVDLNPMPESTLSSSQVLLDLASDMMLCCSGVTGERTVGWKTSRMRCFAMSTAHRTSSAAM